MPSRAKRIDLQNLVFLVYSSNTCYTSVVAEIPDGVKLDLENGTWRFENEGQVGIHRKGCVYKIGSGRRHCEWGAQRGIIGVYDRTDISHLNSMVHASKEATAEPPSPFED